MTNKDIWEIALSQSAIDCHCSPEDFYKDTPVVVLSQSDPHARKYIPLPLECDMVSYGSNIVAQVSPRTRQAVEEYLKGTSPAHGFETPEIYKLNQLLKLGKVPFYCAAWCNLKSVGNAIKCGFRPAWTELTARDETFVESMLRS